MICGSSSRAGRLKPLQEAGGLSRERQIRSGGLESALLELVQHPVWNEMLRGFERWEQQVGDEMAVGGL